MKYTDANGIERQLELATWNGRAVILMMDATKDITGHYIKAVSTDEGALKCKYRYTNR